MAEILANSWHSYPKVHNLGHPAITDLLKDDVIVEEKVDGSQFSFGVFDLNGARTIKVRSKGCELHVDAPEKMFQAAVDVVKEIAPLLVVGWTYRAEYLARPKHNTLAYDRTPGRHLMVFDVNTGHEHYLDYETKAGEALRLGLEVVPLVYQGRIGDIQQFRSLIDRTSALGGQKVEGVVIKNYKRFTIDGKAMIGKFVAEGFKEMNDTDFRLRNPRQGDVLAFLTQRYHTPARWSKAVQHLRERGQIEDSPRDIGKLIREIPNDIKAECEAEIKEALFSWAWDKIARASTAGMPEWYKGQLLKKQFETTAPTSEIEPATVASSGSCGESRVAEGA